MATFLRWGEKVTLDVEPAADVSAVSEITESRVSSAASFFSSNTLVRTNKSRHSNSESEATTNSPLAIYNLDFDDTGLYGRDADVLLLTEAFERSKNSRQVVFVQGPPGCGKSALVNALRQPAADAEGFFLKGKCEQRQDLKRIDKPHSGIAAACQDLCQQILEHRFDPTLQNWKFSFGQVRTKLIQELGSDLSLLCNLIPRLRLVLNAPARAGEDRDEGDTDAFVLDDEEAQSGYQEQKYRFDRAVRHFMRTISHFGPVVLALDDLQWADPSSLELIETLILDEENSSILVVGNYRSDEVADDGSPLVKLIRNIETAENDRLTMNQIILGNLKAEHIQELLVDLFHTPKSKETEALAECIQKKTLGNAFFVIQFLRSLEKKNLLKFSDLSENWNWDMQNISNMYSTENVIDFMVGKLQAMPDGIKLLLPLVASLGAVFHIDHVQLLVVAFSDRAKGKKEGASLPSAKKFLNMCWQEGMIVSLRDNYYQWEHDKVQEAALLLVGSSELELLQFRIGELLLDKLDDASIDENLFVIASLLGENATYLPFDDTRRIRSANISLRAGKKSFLASAFQQAATFLESAILLLPPKHWETHYGLSLEIFSTAAEAEFTVGRYEKARAYCDEVFSQTDRPIMDKRRAYTAVLHCYRADGLIHEGRILCLEVLKKLGVKFPKRGLGLHVLGNIARTRLSLKTTIDTISKLDQVTDTLKIWKMRLFHELVLFCYQSDQHLLPLVIMRGYTFTVQNGLTQYAPAFLSLIGFLSIVVNDFGAGKIYAEKALKLLEKIDNARNVESSTLFMVYQFVLHWQQPAEWCCKPLLRGYHIGISTGDTENAAWCIYCYLEIRFHQGSSLDALSNDCRVYTEKLEGVQQKKIEQFTRVLWQLIMNLTGESESGYELAGEAVDGAELQSEITEKKDEHLQAQLDRFRMHSAFWFAEYKEFLGIAKQTGFDKDAYAKNSPGAFGGVPLAFHISLSALILAGETKGAEKRRLKSLGATYLAKIKKWAAKGNPNVVHYESFLQAETAALSSKSNVFETRRLFEVTILMSESRGYTNDEALAHERFGMFYMKKQQLDEAKRQIDRAIQLYQDWGAEARSDLLRAKFNAFIGSGNTMNLPTEIAVSAEPSWFQ